MIDIGGLIRRALVVGLPVVIAAPLILTPMERAASQAAASAVGATAVEFIPHRAVYDLTLAKSRGKSSMAAVRGRILYDFTGSSCEGYALQFRQVSELDSGEGKVVLSDLRSSSWEDGKAKTFRFHSENFLNQRMTEAVDGIAERGKDDVTVDLRKPATLQMKIDVKVVFPTEHMRRIVQAARAGKTILELPAYDGSENGKKVYNTLTVIGRPIPPEKATSTDAATAEKALAGLQRWPVTISYFEKAAKSGEQTPVYAIGFELYENGVSRDLLLDYNDFAISGKMTKLDVKAAKPCR
jgi:hypothetical protein